MSVYTTEKERQTLELTPKCSGSREEGQGVNPGGGKGPKGNVDQHYIGQAYEDWSEKSDHGEDGQTALRFVLNVNYCYLLVYCM